MVSGNRAIRDHVQDGRTLEGFAAELIDRFGAALAWRAAAALETLAKGLLEFETLTGEEMKGLLQGKRPVREDTSASAPQPPREEAWFGFETALLGELRIHQHERRSA